MIRTDVVVKALSPKAVDVLLRNKAEEEAVRKKYGSIFGSKLKRLPSEEQKILTARLLSQHAFYNAKEDEKFCHRMIGKTMLCEREKTLIYEKIKEEMLKDGLSLNDFDVRFYDEQY